MSTRSRSRPARRAVARTPNPAQLDREEELPVQRGAGSYPAYPAGRELRTHAAVAMRRVATLGGIATLAGVLSCGDRVPPAADGSATPAASNSPGAQAVDAAPLGIPNSPPGGQAPEPPGPPPAPSDPFRAADSQLAPDAPPDNAKTSPTQAPEPPAPPVEPPAPPPEPVSEPAVWGFGLGVTDVPAAVAFYTEVLGLSLERTYERLGRTETVLYASGAARGARLILMEFEDGRSTRNVTAKLVWQSNQASSINRKASTYPDYESRLSLGIVQFDGPETYVQEVGSIFDRGSNATDPYLVAMGFSVSEMNASRAFYSGALGMNETRIGSFSVTDATGRGRITEFAMRHDAGAGLVLQDWSPARDSKDRPVMVVSFVPDAQAAADAVVKAGGSIVEQASRTPIYDNRLLIVAKDPDGYWLDLVQ